MIYFFGIFLILHGIVFFLYAGQSLRLFELKPGMIWPDNSWLLYKVLDVKTLRMLTAMVCSLFGIAFILSGILSSLKLLLWHDLSYFSTVFSSLMYILMWDGKFINIKDQGGIGIILNLFIIINLIFFY